MNTERPPSEIQLIQQQRDRIEATHALESAPSPNRRRPTRSSAPRLGLALAAAAALAGGIVLGGSVGGGGEPEFAAAAVRVAEQSPRLLVGEPGWRVISANDFSANAGQITFGESAQANDVDGDELRLSWSPYGYGRVVASLERPQAPMPDFEKTEVAVLGQRAVVFSRAAVEGAPAATDYLAYVQPAGHDDALEIAGTFTSEAEFVGLLESLHEVSVSEWLSAMPASVVVDKDRATVVDEMLEGLPIPPGLDLDRLRSGGLVADWYQLAATTTNTVACGWLDRWTAATDRGDEAAANEAAEAIASWTQWPVLSEMEAQSRGANEVIAKYADQLAQGDLDPAYRDSFGCGRLQG